MHRLRRPTDAAQWYIDEQTARIVAKSGRPGDRFHIGKLLLQSLKDNPDLIAQIDGATGETETNKSLLERSVRCAIALKNLGLKTGDIIVLMAPNHIHVTVPIYAAMYCGIAVAATNSQKTVDELHTFCKSYQPKVIFCQSEKAGDVKYALNTSKVQANIITFDEGTNSDCQNFNQFLQKYGDDTLCEDFRPSDFDTANTVSLLVETSGTTGISKLVVLTHKIFMTSLACCWRNYSNFPQPTKMAMTVSELQWISALSNMITCPLLGITRLQSSQRVTVDHARFLINTYRPTWMIVGPLLLNQLKELNGPEKCDLTCFEVIHVGGSVVPREFIEAFEVISPTTSVFNAYGMSEAGLIFEPVDTPHGSCGRPRGLYQYRGYLNNHSATKEVLSEDGWFKTGDLLYKDANWNFFYLERINILINYKNHQISPSELEGVIRRHAGVADVAVTGVPSPDGDCPVACVVPRPGHPITPHDIKHLVKETLDESKQLGGVIFMNDLGTTPTGKIDRRKLKETLVQMKDSIML